METISMSVIESIAVTAGIIDSEEVAGPLQRWLEYQAYVELKEWLRSIDELPSELIDEELPVDEVRDWIKGKIDHAPVNFREKIKKILVFLKNSGSNGIEELCRKYCEYKEKMSLGADGITVMLTIDDIKEIIIDTVFDSMIFGGVPVTVLVSFMIRSGILDNLCDCERSR
ncbi:hypothetical protein [Geoalkalibacter halelectricus]|uniref:hypothetical protein n=1 Tax=Geoalkalibacter halelectricus TaxID=2847045 RepID=UPI003D1C7C5F